MTDTGTENDLRQAVQRLTERVDALELSAGNGRLSIGVMSGNLDTTIAAFCITASPGAGMATSSTSRARRRDGSTPTSSMCIAERWDARGR